MLNAIGNVAANFLSPFTPVLTWAAVSLIAPDGSTVVASQNATLSGQVLALNSVTLPTDGTYTVKVTSATGHASSTGNYILAAYDVSPHTISLDLNHSVVGTIAVPFGFDQYTFSAAANTQIQFQLAGGSSPALTYTLTGPNRLRVLLNNATASSGTSDLDHQRHLHADGPGRERPDGQIWIQRRYHQPDQPRVGHILHRHIVGQWAGAVIRDSGQQFGPGDDRQRLVDPIVMRPTITSCLCQFPATFRRRGETYDYGITSTAANQSILVPNGKPTTLYVLVYNDTVKSTPGTYTLLVQSHPPLSSPCHASPGTSAATTPLPPSRSTGRGFTSPARWSALVASNNTIYPATSSTTDLAHPNHRHLRPPAAFPLAPIPFNFHKTAPPRHSPTPSPWWLSASGQGDLDYSS